MSTRHDDARMDWRADKPGHKPRRLPRNFRKALRAYQRNVIPMNAPSRSLKESILIALGFLISIGVLLWQAGVFRP